jgi:hypothetical protein
MKEHGSSESLKEQLLKVSHQIFLILIKLVLVNSKNTQNVGLRILTKMGYEKGKGLGRRVQGIGPEASDVSNG